MGGESDWSPGPREGDDADNESAVRGSIQDIQERMTAAFTPFKSMKNYEDPAKGDK